MADAPKILGTDTLRSAYPKLNSAIDNANEALTKASTAESNSTAAVNTANTAETKADNVQAQFNQVVIDGDSSVEAAQARVKSDGTTFTTLQQRLNDGDAQLAKRVKKEEIMVSIIDFGAAMDEVADDSHAFIAAFGAGHKSVFVPKGIIKISSLDIQGKTIVGAGKDSTVIEGDGDLFVNARDFTLKDCTVRNITTRGKLVVAPTNSAVERSRFVNVSFGKSAYHVYSANPYGTVDWSFVHCIFNDASVISRYLENAWAFNEYDCYTWYNSVGLQIVNGNSVRSYGSVYEYNTKQAVIISASGNDISAIRFDGAHFEGNGTNAGEETIRLETLSANRIRNVSFAGSSFVVPNQTYQIHYVPGGGGNIERISFYDCYTRGSLINDNFPALMVNVEFNQGTIGKSCINVDKSTPRPFNTIAAGNNQDQTGAIQLSVGETHLVTIGTIGTGDGVSFAYQQFLVGRDNAGVIRSTQVVSNASGVNCQIQKNVEDYRVLNGSGMSTTFWPTISIMKI